MSGRSRAADGTRWVMWFGDGKFSVVSGFIEEVLKQIDHIPYNAQKNPKHIERLEEDTLNSFVKK